MYISPEVRSILASKVIRVRELPDGRTVIDRLAAQHALIMSLPSPTPRIPTNYDELLELVGTVGFCLESE